MIVARWLTRAVGKLNLKIDVLWHYFFVILSRTEVWESARLRIHPAQVYRAWFYRDFLQPLGLIALVPNGQHAQERWLTQCRDKTA